ncbi:MAG: polysaccharide deacetylase family protein [Proteobacteria bacterium]|nr:polysaccharide deacetylase family protein [Pseudomonadota bacterium]
MKSFQFNVNQYATQWREAIFTPSSPGERVRDFARNLVINLSSAVNKTPEDKFLRCLYCHYVFDDQTEDFENLIIELKKTGKFVDTDTAIEMLSGKKPIDERYYHLSFDDGFRNNYTNAFPILKKNKVPAIFFIPTALVEADWETARNYCTSDTHYKGVIEMVRWDELKEMVSEGFDIGSHTKTHARLSGISNVPTLLEDEIQGSKKQLEDRLGHICKYISYPFGTRSDIDSEALRIIKISGYIACFGAHRGSIRPSSTDIYQIPRHHFEVQWPISHVSYFARGNREF